MYKLDIYVDLDGDFKWKSKYLSNDGDEFKVISKDRKKLVTLIKDFYKDFKKHLGSKFNIHEDHFKIKYRDTIYDFEDYLYKLLKVYQTIRISFNSGNWSMQIELLEFNENYDLGKGLIKIEENPEVLSLNITSDFKTIFNWTLLDGLIKENEETLKIKEQ